MEDILYRYYMEVIFLYCLLRTRKFRVLGRGNVYGLVQLGALKNYPTSLDQ